MNEAQISGRPLIALFGSASAYRVLMYLENYDKGYASQIAKTFGISLNRAQNQLKKFEEIGLPVIRNEATTRMYYFKQSLITDALRAFLRSMLERLPRTTIETYFRQTRRPSRYAKRLVDAMITETTTLAELATIVSDALEHEGIVATLYGGAAVSI